MKRIKHKLTAGLALAIFVFCLALSASAQAKSSSRVLLVPLDDRPPTYQWVVRMGEIGDAETVAPPRELLGRFTEFGKSDEIVEWIKKQDLKTFDAAVVSIDMLAYGGLVAMREHKTDLATARRRLDFVREMKRRAPRLKIYASSVIMRLAPTGTPENESYRNDLSRWAEISIDPVSREETAALEKRIPAAALADYRAARARDLSINLAAIELGRDRVVEQLILGQDDAKPKGVHVADRERLLAEVGKLNLQKQIGVQPGADELSMLQLARALGDKYAFRPRIKAVYSSEAIRRQVMPYEDRPLHQTVSFQIESVGAREVESETEADILFFVYASRFEPGAAEKFAAEIRKNLIEVKDGVLNQRRDAKDFIVADIDPKGDVQGADEKFTELLKQGLIFSHVSGYAAWNTAGNTVGTALPHGFLYSLSKKTFGFPNKNWKMPKAEVERRKRILSRVGYAQNWFLLNRLLDDYVYHTLVRPETVKFARSKGWNVLRFDAEQTKAVEEYAAPKVRRHIRQHLDYFPIPKYGGLICSSVKDFRFTLPWGRTFEAEIDFELNCVEGPKPVKGAYGVRDYED